MDKYIFFGTGITFVTFFLGIKFIVNLTGLGYPFYKSLKSLEELNKKDKIGSDEKIIINNNIIRNWFNYWIIYSLLFFTESSTPITYFPFYYYLKFMGLIILINNNAKLSGQFYNMNIRPYYLRYINKNDKKSKKGQIKIEKKKLTIYERIKKFVLFNNQ